MKKKRKKVAAADDGPSSQVSSTPSRPRLLTGGASATAGRPPQREERTEVSVRCVLTDAERLTMAGRLADANQRTAEIVAERKEVAAVLRARVAEVAAEVARLAAVLACGYEYRRTACRRVWDYAGDAVLLYRVDDGALVESRPMTDDDRQLVMA